MQDENCRLSHSIEQRLDQWLVEFELVRSRHQAAELIRKGCVSVCVEEQWVAVDKPSKKFKGLVKEDLKLASTPLSQFVSRAGVKLEKAIAHLDLDVAGKVVLDIGQSTGGFTDCLLQRQAKKVIGIEVGHSQVAQTLREDSRVVTLEKTNIKDLTLDQLNQHCDGHLIGLVVMDVSFISITEVIPVLPGLLIQKQQQALPQPKYLLSLVKPQFEVGAKNLGKGGLVRNKGLYDEVHLKVTKAAKESGFQVLDYFLSSLEGGDGNKEFFLFAQLTE